MELPDLLERYANGKRVQDIYTSTRKCGKIEGTSLGGAIMKPRSRRGSNQPMLNVRVKWDDGTETLVHHSTLVVLG